MFWFFVGATAAVLFDRNFPAPGTWLIAKARLAFTELRERWNARND